MRDLMLQMESYYGYYNNDERYHINLVDFQRYSIPSTQILPRAIMQSPDVLSMQHSRFPHSAESDSHVRYADDDVPPVYAIEDAYNSVGALQFVHQMPEFPQQHNDSQSSDTLEPSMTLWRRESCSFLDPTPQTNFGFLSNNYSFHPSPTDYCSPSYSSSVQQDQLTLSDEEPSSAPTDAVFSTNLCNQGVYNEDITDKPYARLIYECLMQAPGHRMMLREIYDWFIQNTTKPRDSGTNGWQNSIRHNLSMNQAFENDKSISSPERGQARKANSVWVLTKHAEQNGVQSTTRYRKSGAVRKHTLSRTPGTQRQRSGARGARATRKARLRTQVQPANSAEVCSLGQELTDLPLGNLRCINGAITGQHGSECHPAPPAVGSMFEALHSPAVPDPFEPDQTLKTEHGEYFLETNDTIANDYFHHTFASPTFDNMTKIETN